MIFFAVLILPLILFGQVRLAKSIRDNILHPKRLANEKATFILHTGFFVLYHVAVVLGVPELLVRCSFDGVISICYIYLILNVMVQIFMLREAECEVESSRCRHFKWVWLGGLALHSILIVMALQDSRTFYGWMMGAGIAYTLYNLGYFFFIYFAEKEIMRMTCMQEGMMPGINPSVNLDLERNEPSNPEFDVKLNVVSNLALKIKSGAMSIVLSDKKRDLESNVQSDAVQNEEPDVMPIEMPERELPPLCIMYGDGYRKVMLEEVRVRNAAAMKVFGASVLFLVPLSMTSFFVADKSKAAQMVGLVICLFLIGAGYLLCCWKRDEASVKSMKIGFFYEGLAEVVEAYPLTIRYLMPKGEKVTKQVLMNVRNDFLPGSVVKIMVRNDEVEKVVREDETFSNLYQEKFRTGMPVKTRKKLDKQMRRAIMVFVLVMVVGIVGWVYWLI